MGKGRSNNAGKKQPNFDDSSNFAKQSQPTEKKRIRKESLYQERFFKWYFLLQYLLITYRFGVNKTSTMEASPNDAQYQYTYWSKLNGFHYLA